MGQSTFSRIENEQTNPSLNSINILLSALNKTHKLSEAIEISNPKLAHSLTKNFAHNYETPFMGKEFSFFFSKTSYRKILLLALSRSGTTKEEVRLEFGNSGLRLLEELLDSNIIFESRGIIKANEDKVTFNQELLKSTLIDCIKENYNPELFGQDKNWLSFQTESINKEKAMKLIFKKLQTAYKEIKEEILYSPEYFGNDKVFIGMVADTLHKELPSREVLQ